MQLIKYPDPVLFYVCENDSVFYNKRKARMDLENEMFAIMKENGGVGLASSQVGRKMIRMFVWNDGGGGQVYNQAIWNPILSKTEGSSEMKEGCLSLPGIAVNKTRATSSILEGEEANGKPMRLFGNSISTRIWQHEMDHLDGILVIHGMNSEDERFARPILEDLKTNSVIV